MHVLRSRKRFSPFTLFLPDAFKQSFCNNSLISSTQIFCTFIPEILSVVRTGIILLLSYYLLGTVCLPLGNFSFGNDLPEMYRHCKAHEDKDMTPLDFVTDHLVNIDGIFDKHCNGDRQKPHSPPPSQHHPIQIVITFQPFTSHSFRPVAVTEKQPLSTETLYNSGFYHKIFHPPVS